ncbi:hypothetical protein PAPYR_3520 [Paratrimastix pyriformis]|uniref:Uncharacterized protein n=1 Tax=Paratrimastix pyriformis TaxID=342808 RepID=A0ABQ8URY4_9EUKA|nr:hypothetical protein PAPYR_3520 [Paratrimastix pyriformis]
MLRQALELIKSGDYVAAAELLFSAFQYDAAARWAGATLPESTKSAFQKLLDGLRPEGSNWKAITVLARLQALLGHPTESKELLQTALNAFSDGGQSTPMEPFEISAMRAWLQMGLQQFDAALGTVLRALEQAALPGPVGPDAPGTTLGQDAATPLCQGGAALDHPPPPAAPSAGPSGPMGISLAQRRADLHFLHGVALRNTLATEEALAPLLRYVELTPPWRLRHCEAHYLLAALQGARGDLEQMEAHFEAAQYSEELWQLFYGAEFGCDSKRLVVPMREMAIRKVPLMQAYQSRTMVAHSVAVAKRTEGNTAFSAQNWRQAAQAYTEGIAAIEEARAQGRPASFVLSAALLSNRAACHLHMGDPAAALADALRAQQVNPFLVRSYQRLSAALTALGRSAEATQAARVGLMIQSDSQELLLASKAGSE